MSPTRLFSRSSRPSGISGRQKRRLPSHASLTIAFGAGSFSNSTELQLSSSQPQDLSRPVRERSGPWHAVCRAQTGQACLSQYWWSLRSCISQETRPNSASVPHEWLQMFPFWATELSMPPTSLLILALLLIGPTARPALNNTASSSLHRIAPHRLSRNRTLPTETGSEEGAHR